jgi:hypothetical protein
MASRFWQQSAAGRGIINSKPGAGPKNFCTAEPEMPIYQEPAQIAGEGRVSLIITWATRDKSSGGLQSRAQTPKMAWVVKKDSPALPLRNPQAGVVSEPGNQVVAASCAQVRRDSETGGGSQGVGARR